MKKKTFYLILIILQLVLAVYTGSQKKSFFGDEIFSYGLANSENYSFLGKQSATQVSHNHGWVDQSYFKDYVTVQKKDAFTYDAPYRNQVNDVHPPLYYVLLHTICSLFPHSFSKWYGLGLNIGILIIIDLLLYHIAKYFLKSELKSLLTVALWSCSAAGLSDIILIRMYLLLTLAYLVFLQMHIKIFKDHSYSVQNFLLLFFSVMLGGLTHYYFYPFAFFMAAPVCVYLLVKNRGALLAYMTSLLAGFACNLMIFPATLTHVFGGYRGTQVVTNLQGRTENVFTKYYLGWINNSIFGGLMLYVFAIFFIVCLVIYLRQKDIKVKDHISPLFTLYSFTTIMSAIVIIKGSQMAQPRYIYALYPWLALVIVGMLSLIVQMFKVNTHTKGFILSVLTLFIAGLSIYQYNVDCLYSDYPAIETKAKRVKGADCLIYQNPGWTDFYTAMPLKFNYDESYFFTSQEIPSLSKILAKRQSKDQIVVLLPDSFTKSQVKQTMKVICQSTHKKHYQAVYSYYSQAFLLS
ncbi:MAG: hypothetical protein PUF83_09560 [Intestinibaculum porci]|uniref:hypothetical protein n=1 Tax=Intestinibaculum porci TaxID=2487118 RepID=UPI00240A8DFC|nr:hypothetical protein [Intestinibaculum porci]MDD6423278.1 hypothetical protein [Intestinibaculum porci]